MNIGRLLEQLVAELDNMDLGDPRMNAEFAREIGPKKDELIGALDYLRMAGLEKDVDLAGLGKFIGGVGEATKATVQAKKTLDEVISSVDEYTKGGGQFEGLISQIERLGALGFEEEDLRSLRTELASRNADRVEAAKRRIFEKTDSTIGDISQALSKDVEDFASRIGDFGKEAASNILGSIISSVQKGGVGGMSVGDLTRSAAGYGISQQELEGLRVHDTPEKLTGALRDLVQGKEAERSEEIRKMLGGIRGFDVKRVGATPEQMGRDLTKQALDPEDDSYSAMQALREARDRGLVSDERVAGLSGATDSEIMHAVGPALGQARFDEARPLGGARTALGAGISRLGGTAALATGVLRGTLDLATPGGRSMVEAGSEAAGSFGSSVGAGIGAALGSAVPGAGTIVGGLGGAAVGGVVGGMVEPAVQPYVSYVNQQRQFNEMFGLSRQGVSFDPLGMAMDVRGDDMPQDYGALRRAQIGARLANPSLSGNEIDDLTQSLADLNMSAKETSESLKTASTLVGEYGMSAKTAAYVTAMGARSQEGSTITAQAVGDQRARLAAQGITGEQYDQMIQSGKDIGEQVGQQAGFEIAQGTAETVGMFGGSNRSEFMESGGARDINTLKATFLQQPQLLAQFSGDPTLQYEAVYEKDGKTVKPEFKEAVNTAMKNYIGQIMAGAGYRLGDGRATVAQSQYQYLQAEAQQMGSPFSVQEILILSEELGKNPNLFAAGDEGARQGNEAARREVAQKTGQAGKSEREVLAGSSEGGIDPRSVQKAFTPDWMDAALGAIPGASLAHDVQSGRLQKELGVAGQIAGNLWDQIRGRSGAEVEEAVKKLPGEQKGLAGLSNVRGFDPQSLRVSAQREDLGDLLWNVNRFGPHEGSYQKQRDALRRGSLRFRLDNGARGGKGYTADEISDLIAQGEVTQQGGRLRLKDEAKQRASGTSDVKAEVKVTATDKLSKMFNFTQTSDSQTSAGQITRAQAKDRRDRKGGKMAEDARVK